MRAHEALILGSTILKPLPRSFDTNNGRGCALGMINRAVGGSAQNYLYKSTFPWMETTNVPRPCTCAPCDCEDCKAAKESVASVVIHLFDHHNEVKVSPSNAWSIEQIADWLRTVDPTPEPAPPPPPPPAPGDPEPVEVDEILIGVK